MANKGNLVGKWVRQHMGHDFYWKFNADDTCETDEIPGHSVWRGTYSFDGRKVFAVSGSGYNSFDAVINGNNLTVIFSSGNRIEYRRGY